MKDSNEHRLDALLAQLPRHVAPSADLWTGINEQIAQPVTPSVRPMRVVLSAVAGFVVGALCLAWITGGGAPMAQPTFDANPSTQMVAARANLMEAYRARLPALDPKTRVRVERDLAVIRAAQADLADAYSKSPESEVTTRLYESAVRQEFDLYETVVRATEPVNRRTSL